MLASYQRKKENIAKWTTQFNQINKMMYNYTTTLRIRGNYLQKQLNKQQNNLLKDWKNCKKKIHTQKNVVNKTFFIVFFFLSTLSLIPFNACFPNKNPNFPKESTVLIETYSHLLLSCPVKTVLHVISYEPYSLKRHPLNLAFVVFIFVFHAFLLIKNHTTGVFYVIFFLN